MHAAFVHLAKRVVLVRGVVAEVVAEIEQQAARESKALDEHAYGDEFNEEMAPIQAELMESVQECLERFDDALRAIDDAHRALEDINRL